MTRTIKRPKSVHPACGRRDRCTPTVDEFDVDAAAPTNWHAIELRDDGEAAEDVANAAARRASRA